MSHLHFPDGVLPWWLIACGWVVTGALLLLVSRQLSEEEQRRRLPLLGVMAAFMLVGMSTEIVPVAYHVNLTVLAGIVLGPGLGLLAAFVVNLILAFFGHGGLTVVGLNTLIIGAECALGSYLFRWLFWGLLRNNRWVGLSAGVVTVVTLLISTTLLVSVVGASRVDWASAREMGALDTATFAFVDPFHEGIVASRLLAPEVHQEGEKAGLSLGFADFVKAVVILGAFGWALEALVTGIIVSLLWRLRPGLVATHRAQVSLY